MALLDAVARELQSRYTFTDIDTYLAQFNVPTPHPYNDYSGKHAYSKAALSKVSDAVLARIVDDLEITTAAAKTLKPPRNWPDDSKFRLFISHVAAEKEKAGRLRECLKQHDISGFVAHEDILPTAEWQIEIERALLVMDAFIAIHTPGFSKSVWTQQEVGFAVARGVKIISLKMGEDPTGFISKHQALPRLTKKAEQIAKEIKEILLADELTKDRLETVILNNEIPF